MINHDLQTTAMIEYEIKILWDKRFKRHHMEQIPVPPMKVVRLDYQQALAGMSGGIKHPIETPLDPASIFASMAGSLPGYLDYRVCSTPLRVIQTDMGLTVLLGVCEHGKIFVYRSDKDEQTQSSDTPSGT
jgi:hypothetical protein